MIGFESRLPVAVSQTGATEWELIDELIYHGQTQTFRVPPGQSTDFASVPAVLSWLVPNTTGIAAAVLHDYLWRCEIPAGRIGYRDADGLLRQALGTLGVATLRRHTMWAAVRWGALLTRSGGWRGWHKDAPAVLGITVLALPVVAPALLLLPSLALFAAAEYVVSTLTRTDR